MLLKELRKEKNMSQADLAKRIGVSRSTVSMWEIGASQPDNDLLLKISQVLNVSLDRLLENEKYDTDSALDFYICIDRSCSMSQMNTKKVPLLGDIACGEPIWAEEQHGEFVSVSDDIDADFCLRAKGDSMTGARIYDGDIVFIRQQSSVDNGEIAAVIIDGEATLKRVYYYREKNKLVLNPENPAFEPLVYIDSELDEVRILGKAVAFQSLVR